MSYDTFKDITIQQLEVLIALIEAGSFTRAAGKLFLSQPSLTKQIQNLEEAVGTRLVNRGSTGISLTPEGQVIYDYAKRTVRLREDAKERIGRIKDQESGHIYVSASTIPATYILPHFLSHLKQTHHDIQVHMQMHDSEETLQIVLNDQAEMGFIGKEPLNKKLIVERLWKDHLVVAAPVHHHLTERGTVTVEELTKTPFILREKGSATRDIVEECLQSHLGTSLSRFNVICEMGSSEAVKEAILAGLGVSILSIFAIKRELSQGLLTVVNVSNCSMERHFYLIYKKQFPLMKYHRRFLDLVKGYSPFEEETGGHPFA
ncbi:MAG: selenium metabolism-associated LysR family transcriptional regulator [Deltaproteobacteria bacterium]|nr:selenium metabolism-associated LysR family transcriptional regulator [Deltaproteobacteria bacterium]